MTLSDSELCVLFDPHSKAIQIALEGICQEEMQLYESSGSRPYLLCIAGIHSYYSPGIQV